MPIVHLRKPKRPVAGRRGLTIVQALLRSASRLCAPEAVPMQSFMAVPVDVLKHRDYPIGRTCLQATVVNRHSHSTGKPADRMPTGFYEDAVA